VVDPALLIGIASIVVAGLTICFGTIAPALAEGRAVAQALLAIAQQPDGYRPATGRSRHSQPHSVRRAGDDRIHRNLLFRGIADPDLRQSVLEPFRCRDRSLTMKLDWFTIAAQIGNFLLLLWLLKRFLYRPILAAMSVRQQRIATALTEAQAKAAAAEALQQDYLARQRELAAHRETELAQAQEETAVQRQIWLTQARAEVDEARKRWRAELEREQRNNRQTLQREAGNAKPANACWRWPGGRFATWATPSWKRKWCRSCWRGCKRWTAKPGERWPKPHETAARSSPPFRWRHPSNRR